MTRSQLQSCPVCGWKTLPIVYGLPTLDMFERTDIVLGGCIVDEMYPNLSCSNCNWQGQKWSILAPLPYRLWILQDPTGTRGPIGLVSERFDSIIERFFLGKWEDPHSTEDYKYWLKAVGQPVVWSGAATGVELEKFAMFRSGDTWTSEAELQQIGLKVVDHQAPKFKFDGPAWPPKSGGN